MARPQKQSRDELRQLALKAAEHIVASDGIGALNARRVAGEIGCAVGTLYLVFTNMEGLILALNGRTLTDLHQALLPAATDKTQPLMRMHDLAAAYLAFARAHPHRWALVFEYRATGPVPASYQQQVADLFVLVETAMSPLRLGPDERARAARTLWCSVHGICVLAMTDKLKLAGEPTPELLLRSLVDHYLGGLTSGR